MSTINLTPIIEAVFALLAAIVTAFVIPWIKSKLNENQLKELQIWVNAAVAAAEQIFSAPNSGAEKKQYVIEFLKSKGFTVDMDSIDNLIESAVYALKGGV